MLALRQTESKWQGFRDAAFVHSMQVSASPQPNACASSHEGYEDDRQHSCYPQQRTVPRQGLQLLGRPERQGVRPACECHHGSQEHCSACPHKHCSNTKSACGGGLL